MSRGGLPAIRARQRSARGQSAGLAGRICRRGTATVVVAWPAGFWMPASRRPCCCRGRRAYAGSASRCGAMNTANGGGGLSRRSGKPGRSLAAAAGSLAAGQRKAARAPGTGIESCPPLQTQDTAPLVLSGIRDGAVIKRLPGEARVMLPLQTSGGEGRRWWFINGEPLEAAGARTTLMLDKPGEWQLVVMDEAGQTAAASFTLQ